MSSRALTTPRGMAKLRLLTKLHYTFLVEWGLRGTEAMGGLHFSDAVGK